jgi:hypothetical protein
VDDTLKKVDPSGQLLWAKPIGWIQAGFAYSGSGFYEGTTQPGSDQGTIVYFDSTGTQQWTYPLPALLTSGLQTDPQGNLIVIYDSLISRSPNKKSSSKLLKLNTSGARVFEIDLPQSRDPQFQSQYFSPLVESTGKIWILAQATTTTSNHHGAASLEQTVAFDDVYLLDPNSGSVLLHKSVFQQPISINRDDGRGHTKTLASDHPYYNLDLYKNNLVLSGTLLSETNTDNGSIITRVAKSEWRITIIDQQGNLKIFRYRGKGNLRESVNRLHFSGDQLSNSLGGIQVGANDALYIHGVVARGNGSDGPPGYLHQDDVFMRYDPVKNKILWKVTHQDIGYSRLVLYQPAQKLFLDEDQYRSSVYNDSGALSSKQLTFTDPIWKAFPSGQNGFYYREAEGGYLAKYNISGVVSKQSYSFPANRKEVVYRYSLHQNYPNPFNPTTKIAFELANDALVTVIVYNTLGQEVATLAHRKDFSAGDNELEFAAGNLPSGVYYFRVTAEGLTGEGIRFTSVKKMVLIK